MFNKFKNLTITLLILLAVYQTNKLWFEGFSSHNFFYSILENGYERGSDSNTESEIEYIAVNNGGGRYLLTYDNNSMVQIRLNLKRAANAVVGKGSFSRLDKDELKEYLKSRCIVIHYDFDMDRFTFKSIYGSEPEIYKGFDNCLFNVTGTNGIRITLFSSNTLEGVVYELNEYSDIQSISEIMDAGRIIEGSRYYVSSVQNNYNVFVGNEFIPAQTGETYYYNISEDNPVKENGVTDVTALDSYANNYFENPVLKWSSMDGNTYIFSDERRVVKYYPNNVMEYKAYYGYNNNEKDFDFAENLSAAEDFLSNDVNLKNEVYLTGYYTLDNITTFYFDYKLDNFTLSLSESMKKKTGLKSIVEVTVENGHATGCRRYIADYQTTIKEPVYTDKTFLEVIDKVLYETESEYINELRLGYMETGEGVGLYYILNIDGRIYTVSAENEPEETTEETTEE